MLKPVLHDVAVVHDKTAGFLSLAWWAGDLIDRTTHHTGVDSWADIADFLRDLRDAGHTITKLQVWSHGYSKGPVIKGKTPTDAELRVIKAAAPSLKEIWFRACDVGRNPANVYRISQVTRCDVVSHCVVISAGAPLTGWLRKILPWKRRFKPWSHGRIVGLRYNQRPWWDPYDDTLKGCLVTEMVVPAHAWKG